MGRLVVVELVVEHKGEASRLDLRGVQIPHPSIVCVSASLWRQACQIMWD